MAFPRRTVGTRIKKRPRNAKLRDLAFDNGVGPKQSYFGSSVFFDSSSLAFWASNCFPVL